MKPDPVMQAKVRKLMGYLEKKKPHIYRGLVTRFTQPTDIPAVQSMAGIFDFVGSIASKTVDAMSNFASSNGFDKILTAASPFLANKAEKEQLEIQIKRVGAGLDPEGKPTTTQPAPSTTAPAATGIEAWPMWAKVAGGVAGVAGIGWLISMLTRRR